ncbi:hypothetical protein JCM19046_2912 [Bacillus sp. JCM 19046]|nr:hypothetical protein JCM19046_2912 [Bacillus sp. JCM 19046]
MKGLASLFTIGLMTVLFSFGGNNAQAQSEYEGATIHTTPPEEGLYEELNGFYVELPYSAEDVTIEKGTSPAGHETVTLVDRETGDIIETIGLKPADSVGTMDDRHPLLPPPLIEPPTEEFMEMFSTREYNGLEVVLNVRFVVTKNAEGNYEDVVDIRDAWWTTGSGPHTLEDSNTDILHGDFPVREFTVTGQTTIVTAIEASARAGFEAAGFSVGVDVSGTYYARMTVRDTMVFDLFS